MNSKSKDLTYMAISIALLAVCSWISIPFIVPFTMQTFAVFFVLGFLGGKKGTLSIIIYILLGAVGVPVFAGFAGGFGILFGNTGGYILGFILSGLFMWAAEKIFGKSRRVFFLSAFIGLFLCYTFGSLWFMALYFRSTGTISLLTVLSWCVFPFVIPDVLKILLAGLLKSRVTKALTL